jgi:hypothetical protein
VAFELKLPRLWERRGWKAKIRDRERVEPPHVTIMHKANSWRWGLRSQQFLDKKPDPKEIPAEVLAAARESISVLRKAWDRMYPENPIVSKTPRKPKTKGERKHK